MMSRTVVFIQYNDQLLGPARNSQLIVPLYQTYRVKLGTFLGLGRLLPLYSLIQLNKKFQLNKNFKEEHRGIQGGPRRTARSIEEDCKDD